MSNMLDFEKRLSETAKELHAEAERDAITDVGRGIRGGAESDDNTETIAVARIRRTLPPAAIVATKFLHLRVAGFVVSILSTLTRYGVSCAAKDFDFCQQEAII